MSHLSPALFSPPLQKKEKKKKRKSPYFCPLANATAVVRKAVVQNATGPSVWRGQVKHCQKDVWICWISHLLLWGADKLSHNDGNNAGKVEYRVSKCTQEWMVPKWLSLEAVCHVGTVPAVPQLPSCFSTAPMASPFLQWRAVVFVLLFC